MAEKQVKSNVREYAEAIVIALILALLIRTFVVQAFKIPSGSMEDTLAIGDQILVSKFLYGMSLPFTDMHFFALRQPRRGDIIVFSYPKNKEREECTNLSKNIVYRIERVWSNKNILALFKDDCRDFIKRVVGVGGDTVEIKNRVVYINGAALDEPYTIYKNKRTEEIIPERRDNMDPVIVPRGKFFVMGDNRDNSHDSRFWGYVDMSEIKGKAFIVYWSWDRNAVFYMKIRWGRLGKIVH